MSIFIVTRINADSNICDIISVDSVYHVCHKDMLEDIEEFKQKETDLDVEISYVDKDTIRVRTKGYFGSKYLKYIYQIIPFEPE